MLHGLAGNDDIKRAIRRTVVLALANYIDAGPWTNVNANIIARAKILADRAIDVETADFEYSALGEETWKRCLYRGNKSLLLWVGDE